MSYNPLKFGPQQGPNKIIKTVRAGDLDNTDQQYQTKYPHASVEKDKCGHIFVRDNTPGAERITMRHCTGTGFDYLYDGTVMSITVGNEHRYIKGGLSQTVDRNYDSKVTGHRRDIVDGGYHQEVQLTHSVVIGGDSTSIHGGNHTIQARKNYNIGSANSVTITVGRGNSMSYVHIAADGSVSINATSDMSFNAPNGKIAFNATDIHLGASGSMELGFTNFKISDIILPNVAVGWSNFSATSGPPIPYTELPTTIASKTTPQPQQQIAEGIKSAGEQATIATYSKVIAT